MKNSNNNKVKIDITKTSRGSPNEVPSIGFFDYIIVIDFWLLWLYYNYFMIIYDYLWLFVIIKWLFMIICDYFIMKC